ncbi:MAG: tetratricopeptide repeat protein [Anaerolineae bacterium]|nr:tetratricopeptide repeat protein [Anaerolineae bacterium]MBT7072046.1 tetratricopeptide repeat protein [Anaerolineae bacterium]MBT7326670.1 tetratricopeptide repeat protein [Anaerolineae bacterium]
MERRERFNQAVIAAKQKKYKPARYMLRGLLAEDPNDVDSLLLYALVAENKEDAIQSLKKILQNDPDHRIAFIELSKLKYAPPQAIPVPLPTPTAHTSTVKPVPPPIPTKKGESKQEIETQKRPKKKKNNLVELIFLGVLVFTCLCIGFGVIMELSKQGILPQLTTSVPTPTENQVFDILYENINAMNVESVSRYMATVHPDSAAYDTTEAALQKSFQLLDLQVQIDQLEVVKQTRSEVQVSFKLTTRKIRGPDFRDNLVTGVMTLRKDGELWKIYKQKTDDVIYLD